MVSNVVSGGYEGEIVFPGPTVGVTISADGSRALVCVPAERKVMVVDTATGRIVGVVGDDKFRQPISSVSSRDGRRGYYLHNNQSGVTVFNVSNWSIERISIFGANMRAMVVSQDGAHLYVAREGSVSVIDALNLGLIKDIPFDGVIDDLVVSPDGLHVYILAEGRLCVARVSDWDMRSIPLDAGGSGLGCMSLSPDGRRAYVVGSLQGGTVQVVDIDREIVVGAIYFGQGGGRGCKLHPGGKYFYFTTAYETKLCVVDVENEPKIVKSIFVGGNPIEVDITPDGSRVYVAAGLLVKVFAVVEGIPVAGGVDQVLF